MLSQILCDVILTPTGLTTDGLDKDSPSKTSSKIELTLTSATTTASASTLAGCTTDIDQQKLAENKSLNTYIESMSDEELEDILVKYNLLEKDNSNQKIK